MAHRHDVDGKRGSTNLIPLAGRAAAMEKKAERSTCVETVLECGEWPQACAAWSETR